MTGVNLTRIKRDRLQQAGALVRRVKVIREPELPPVQVRAYVARRELTSEAETLSKGIVK